MSSGSTGVVLINTGGPRSEAEVADFIRAMLSDPLVMPLPWPLRPLLAGRIARRRAATVAARYRQIGFPSPVIEGTRELSDKLSKVLGDSFEVACAFRYCRPDAQETVAALAAKGISRLIILPAYPQRSRSTTATAVRAFSREASRLGIAWRESGSFPDQPGFIAAMSQLLDPLADKAEHVIFCAHGLPQKTVTRGDGYPDEVRRTAEALAARLPSGKQYSLAFQSRVGRMQWTRPYLTDEIRRLAGEGVVRLLVVPISFVCENLETLHELDVEAAQLADSVGISSFLRAPVAGAHPDFVAGLRGLVIKTARAAGWEARHGA
ncbi:MAG TPA: ferrochelatase [Myxococcota bacterium]|nr:ferrochelatase [Myxococcota bacterium]